MAVPQIDTIVAALGAALALSFTVERIIEGVKNVFAYFIKDTADIVVPPLAKLERRADAIVEKYQDQTTRLQEEAQARSDAGAAQLSQTSVQGLGEWDERVGVFTFTIEPATAPNMTRVLREFMIQILGLIAGIVLAHGAQLKLFSLLLQGAYVGTPLPPLPDGVDYLLTGMLIGGGSAPIHMLIKFISERRITPAAADTDTREAAPTVTEAASTAPTPVTTPVLSTDLFNVPYDGGVDCARLQNTH
ncbi:MAG: hypothetical protein OEW08_12760, partial [Gammaproteobacteria bacterium]|nr:hypothetical protein [Gammaproteobacteria bacterium]